MPKLTLSCTKNVTVSSKYTGNSYRNGYLAFGRGSSNDEYRLLLGFSASAIPAGSTVESAVLTVPKVTGSIGSNAGFTAQAAQITSSWTTSATWSSGNPSFTEAGAASSATGAGHSGNITFDVTSIVQAWVDGAAQYGILLRKSTSGGTYIKVAEELGASIAVTYGYKASTFSTAGKVTAGTEAAITVTAQNASLTHDLMLTFGSESWTLASKATAAGLTGWTPPLDACNQIPDDISGTGTLTLRTYNGSTLVGSTSKAVSIQVPSSAVPSLESVTAEIAGNLTVAGWGIYAKNQSKVRLTAMGGAGIYGSSITSYNFSGNGWAASTPSSSETSATITKAGIVEFSVTATDSRGRTSAAKSVAISVEDYEPPALKSASINRSDANGIVAAEGTYVLVTATAAFSTIGSNAITVMATVSPGGWTAPLSDGRVVLGNGGIAVDGMYTVEIVATDKIGGRATRTLKLYSADRPLNVTEDGTGVAIGGYAKSGQFTSYKPSVFMGSQLPVFVDDTGWNAMGFTDAVSPSGSNYGRHENGDCYYRVINKNHVYVAFNCSFSYAGSAIYVNANQIPAAYRPKRNVYSMCAIGGRSMARIVVTSTGHLVIDWVQVISAGAATTSATVNWLDAYIDYWLEEVVT